MLNRFTMVVLLVSFTLFGSFCQATEYDVVDRYSILFDKFKTEEMLRPFGHDFIFDFAVALNKDVLDMVKDGKAVMDKDTDAQKFDAAQEFLTKYDKSEQVLNIKLNLGVPLPTFHAFGMKIIPDLRASAQLGMLMGIRAAALTSLLDLIPADAFPEAIRSDALAAIAALGTLQPNDDIAVKLAASNYSPAITEFANQNTGKWIVPAIGVPNLFIYARGEAKVGPKINFVGKKYWFGQFHLYGMMRADRKLRITADLLAKDSTVIKKMLGSELNTQTSINVDSSVGYKYRRYTLLAGIEEIKLTVLSDNKTKGGNLVAGYDPMFRVHGSAKYQLLAFSLTPFFGLHQRSGYDLSDGIYFGGTFGAFLWNDRLGLQFQAMLDNAYMTLTPRIKLWFMQLEYSLKLPVKTTLNDVKLSAMHSANLRFFF